MTRDTLIALAIRCETATGPDHKLDAEIALAAGWAREYDDWWWSPHIVAQARKAKRSKWGLGVAPLPVPPTFTAGLDAALTLVPAGHEWLRKSTHTMTVFRVPKDPCLWVHHNDCNGATPALALCAAALRARAALADGGA